jgi:hypothetical protein
VKAVRPAFNLYFQRFLLSASVARRESGSLGLTGHIIGAQPVNVSAQFATFPLTGIIIGPSLALYALPGYEILTVSERGSRFQRRDRHGGLHGQNG